MQQKLWFKQLLLLHVFALTTTSFFAQDLYFEQSNGTSSTFGQIDVFQQSSTSLRDNIAAVNSSFDKTEGWELLAIDGFNYYFQITDTTSDDYGQIDIWNNQTNTRSNYGNLSSIFTDPTFWTLGGADEGILYFSSAESNSEIVSWDGTEITSLAYLRDIITVVKYWRFAGYHDGIMYIEWQNESNASPSITTWDGTTVLETYDNTDFYTNYNDAYLFGVSNFVNLDHTGLFSDLEKVKNHILGTSILTSTEFESITTSINLDYALFTNNYDVIKLALEIIELYDTNNAPLFTTNSTTLGGFSRTATGYDIENMILLIMQTVMDNSYTEANITTYPELFNNTLFETSSFFPGSVAPPTDASVNYTVKINGTHVRKPGTQANYETEDARRPTGCYLAPGSIAKVTVPSSLIGIGASILVGAQTWDLSSKSTIKRMDRVTLKYDINSTTTTIANPLGGGVYINVPYLNDLGLIDVTIENVVRSPYYANTVANQTTLTEWQNVERLRDAPWTDFETDKIMIQIPTSWIYAFDDPETALADWDLAMDGISELLARPLIRSKTVIYAQVDVTPRGTANYPGYPQSNVAYNPYTDYKGYKKHYLVDGPRNERGYLMNVLFHEQGHAEKIYKFRGEIESFVNFLWVPVYNKKFGIELNQAFEDSFAAYGLSHSIEEAAISWMITENFREGNQMSTSTSENQQEFSYQPRGHAKYADLTRLFGWDVLETFYATVNELYENGEIDYSNNVNNVPADDRLLRLSEAAGYDLRPLIHFWGIQSDDFDSLATEIENDGLKKSTAIYDQLSYYKTIVPMDNETFRNFGLEDYTETKIENSTYYDHVSQTYSAGFFKKWWDDYGYTQAEKTIDQIQAIIDLYFPDGRPEEDNSSCTEITPTISGSSLSENSQNTLDNMQQTAWSSEGDGEYLIYDLGAIYDICNLEINFQDKLSQYNYFDIEVSRDNQTYLAVKQDLSSYKTTELYDAYSVSRNARYIKITFNGNEFDDWNIVNDVKIYTTGAALSVEDNTLKETNNISLFPVPAKDILTINGLTSPKTEVEIYDIRGTLIQSTHVTLNNSSINTSKLTSGVYFIKINLSNNNSLVKKFIIKK